MQPVFKTPEFWATLIGQVVSMIVLFGGLSAEQGTELTTALQSISGAVLSVLTILGFIKAQSTRKAAATALMVARLQGVEGDPIAMGNNLLGEVDKLYRQL